MTIKIDTQPPLVEITGPSASVVHKDFELLFAWSEKLKSKLKRNEVNATMQTDSDTIMNTVFLSLKHVSLIVCFNCYANSV